MRDVVAVRLRAIFGRERLGNPAGHLLISPEDQQTCASIGSRIDWFIEKLSCKRSDLCLANRITNSILRRSSHVVVIPLDRSPNEVVWRRRCTPRLQRAITFKISCNRVEVISFIQLLETVGNYWSYCPLNHGYLGVR